MIQPQITYRRAIPADFDGILCLQHQNLLTTLQGEDLSQGFLSLEFTREQLRRVNTEIGIFVALRDKTVIGYLMAESVEFAAGSPLMAHMLKRLTDGFFNGIALSSCCLFVYGPVCVDRQQRGHGVLEALFGIMKETLRADYDVGVAFVSENNPRSLHAHRHKLGMKVVDKFEFNGQKYNTLVFDTGAAGTESS